MTARSSLPLPEPFTSLRKQTPPMQTMTQLWRIGQYLAFCALTGCGTVSPPVSSGQPQSGTASRFAGTWVGTMREVPWGNIATELVVDQTGTTMLWQDSFKNNGLAKTQRIGDTLRASFQVGVTATWSITPQPDGATAQVRLQAFMNDQTAVFRRVIEPGAIRPEASTVSRGAPARAPTVRRSPPASPTPRPKSSQSWR